MACLREIPRTAAFAWSRDAKHNSIVTGTKAGAVEADFSDAARLELWDLDFDNAQRGAEARVVSTLDGDSKSVPFLQYHDSMLTGTGSSTLPGQTRPLQHLLV